MIDHVRWFLKEKSCHKYQSIKQDYYARYIFCFFFHYQLTVVSHCSQKTFKVAIIEYWNSSAYIQQMIDWILRLQQKHIKVYVNNIVIFF